jgi:hypothetical protein
MDTRRFHRHSPSDAIAAFRWLGWVMLMMFVLVETAHAAAGGAQAQVDTAGPPKRALSEAIEVEAGVQRTPQAPAGPTDAGPL